MSTPPTRKKSVATSLRRGHALPLPEKKMDDYVALPPGPEQEELHRTYVSINVNPEDAGEDTLTFGRRLVKPKTLWEKIKAYFRQDIRIVDEANGDTSVITPYGYLCVRKDNSVTYDTSVFYEEPAGYIKIIPSKQYSFVPSPGEKAQVLANISKIEPRINKMLHQIKREHTREREEPVPPEVTPIPIPSPSRATSSAGGEVVGSLRRGPAFPESAEAGSLKKGPAFPESAEAGSLKKGPAFPESVEKGHGLPQEEASSAPS